MTELLKTKELITEELGLAATEFVAGFMVLMMIQDSKEVIQVSFSETEEMNGSFISSFLYSLSRYLTYMDITCYCRFCEVPDAFRELFFVEVGYWVKEISNRGK